jgi:membrane-bound lytic murein transglycosylase
MADGPVGGWVEIRLPNLAKKNGGNLLSAAIAKQDVSSAICGPLRMYF